VRARTISDEMAAAVAEEPARFARERGLREDDILPHMDDWDVHVRVAVAAARAAQAQGLARVTRSSADVEANARRLMQGARDATTALMRAGLIPAAEPW
jgi:malate dehydrogenase (oxaloacetate-decarboxylating)